MGHGKRAKENGLKAEEIAKEFLPKFFDTVKVEFINSLIDFYVNGHYIEVKSCLEWQIDSSHGEKGRRRGRFVIYKDQHDFLLKNNGFYLFVMRRLCGKTFIKLVRAKDVPVNFNNRNKCLVVWTKVMGEVV